MIQAAVSQSEDAREKDGEESAVQPRNGNQEGTADHNRYVALSLEALRVERETAIRLRDEGRIKHEVLRRIERELDLSESRIASSDET